MPRGEFLDRLKAGGNSRCSIKTRQRKCRVVSSDFRRCATGFCFHGRMGVLVQFPRKSRAEAVGNGKMGMRSVPISCIGYFSNCCDEMVDEWELKGKKDWFGLTVWGYGQSQWGGRGDKSWCSQSHESTDKNRDECSRSPHLILSLCFYSVLDPSACNDAWAICSQLSSLKIPSQVPPEACFLDTPQSSQVDNRD